MEELKEATVISRKMPALSLKCKKDLCLDFHAAQPFVVVQIMTLKTSNKPFRIGWRPQFEPCFKQLSTAVSFNSAFSLKTSSDNDRLGVKASANKSTKAFVPHRAFI